jgi:hypothetical protein
MMIRLLFLFFCEAGGLELQTGMNHFALVVLCLIAPLRVVLALALEFFMDSFFVKPPSRGFTVNEAYCPRRPGFVRGGRNLSLVPRAARA